MKIEKIFTKNNVLIAAACAVVLGASLYMEKTDSVFQEDGTIERNSAGKGDKDISLILNADGLPENYDYSLHLEEAGISEEEAENYFLQAKEEINTTFWADGENADYVTQDVNPQDSYSDGLVTAEWYFDDYTYITSEGVITVVDEDGESILPEDGMMLQATAQMVCGEYNEDYTFSFMVFSPQLTVQEQLIADIKSTIREEMEQKGIRFLRLPDEVDGVSLNWSDKKTYQTLKVFFWLAAICVLLKVAAAEEEQDRQKKRKEELSREYPEVVSKISILMGAGMSLKQAWTAVANRYEQDRKSGIFGEKPAYEEMLLTLREIRDGSSEKMAYQRFGERCQVNNFYRLSRILVRNLQKGNKDLCEMLQREAEEAFEDRKLQARKKGEEAGTKMLIPLMLMMVIVIAIVLVPVFLGMSF